MTDVDATTGRTAVTVRPMQPTEGATVRSIAARAFDRFDLLLFSTRGREVLVATDGDDRIVGGVVLHATPPGRLGSLGIVHFIFADPEAGIPGIGSALRDAADARFAELGCVETSARIDVVNSASQALHRSGGYRPTTVVQQLRRWGWRTPIRWWQAGTGFDPGMQLWLRPAPPDRVRTAPWWPLLTTALLNLALLAIVAVRSPRAEVGGAEVALTLLGTVVVLLGARELAIRLAARAQGSVLGHVSWGDGVPLAAALAAAVGVWFPLTGSSTTARPGWRHDRDLATLGRAHLAGALTIGALAWAVVLLEPTVGGLAWAEARRAAVMLALFDLVFGFSPMIGTAARHVREWSTAAWTAIAVVGVGPLLVTLT